MNAPKMPRTGNVTLLLNEIGHALDRFTTTGEPTVIDLGNIPLAPEEMDEIEAALGRGEVEARLTAQGESEIRETSYPGVWRVTHMNEAGAPMARYVEITDLPAILAADPGDMRAGRIRLDRQLDILRKMETPR